MEPISSKIRRFEFRAAAEISVVLACIVLVALSVKAVLGSAHGVEVALPLDFVKYRDGAIALILVFLLRFAGRRESVVALTVVGLYLLSRGALVSIMANGEVTIFACGSIAAGLMLSLSAWLWWRPDGRKRASALGSGE